MKLFITLLIALTALCSGCAEKAGPGASVGTAKPAQLRTIDNSRLSLVVRIDNQAQEYAGELRPDGRWYVVLNIELDVTHNYLASWYGRVGGTSVLLLEVRGEFYANSETLFAQASGDAEMTSSGAPQFDSDCDGASNLEEVNADDDPLSLPGCLPPTLNPETPNDMEPPPMSDDLPPPPDFDFPVPEMVALEGDCFMMGAPEDDPFRKEDQLYHEVCLDPFSIGAYEVTFEQYNAFAGSPGIPQTIPGDRNWGMGRRPVMNVSWNDAVAYTEWLSQQTGEMYRLPTEAEWEYAARGGTETPFWTGDCLRDDEEHFNSSDPYGCGIATGQPDRDRSRPVGSLQKNLFDLYDMLGNVLEMTCSAYVATYDGTEKTCNDDPDVEKVVRGGSYARIASWSRVAHRTGTTETFTVSGERGFRVVREIR